MQGAEKAGIQIGELEGVIALYSCRIVKGELSGAELLSSEVG